MSQMGSHSADSSVVRRASSTVHPCNTICLEAGWFSSGSSAMIDFKFPCHVLFEMAFSDYALNFHVAWYYASHKALSMPSDGVRAVLSMFNLDSMY